MTSGLSGSPAPTTFRGGVRSLRRSAWISMRHTVGGAQKLVTPHRSIWAISASASKRGALELNTVASAFHGAKTLLHACLAQPGEEMFRWTSPGSSPIQYIVDRCPTGYDACVCSTSFGWAVVPDVKYSSRVSSARVFPSGVKSGDDSA